MNRISLQILKNSAWMLLAALIASGCATGGGTGALAGAGVGALVGQIAGGDTAATLIGAGIGTGVGYIIGNEADKAEAKKRDLATQSEMTPFAGTAWQLLSVNRPLARPAKSLVARFNADGTVTTTRIFDDGTTETDREKYRVVGDTLIINKPDYIINAKYRIEGDRLYLDAADRSAIFAKV
jgi:hypothetical protein